MTKNEALKAAIDGKKVRHKSWTEFDGAHRILDQIAHDAKVFMDVVKVNDGFEIVPEYVDFATAWKAYEAGKEIVSVSHNNIKRKCGTYVNDKNVRFLPEEIRGKWLILEDE